MKAPGTRPCFRLTVVKKIELIEHYINHAETLFGSWGIIDAGARHMDAWQTTFETIGRKLQYRNKEQMMQQLNSWIKVLEAKIEPLKTTGEGFVKQLSELDQTLYSLMKKLPKKSKV